MSDYELDITGKVCPFCLLLVKKQLARINSGDILHVLCDHLPAATDTIPFNMQKMNYPIESEEIEPGLWKLHITKS